MDAQDSAYRMPIWKKSSCSALKNHQTPFFSHSSGTRHLKLSIQFTMPVLVSTRNRYNAKLQFGNGLCLALLTWVQSYADPPLLFSFFFCPKPLKQLEFMILRYLRHTKSGFALQSWECNLPPVWKNQTYRYRWVNVLRQSMGSSLDPSFWVIITLGLKENPGSKYFLIHLHKHSNKFLLNPLENCRVFCTLYR